MADDVGFTQTTAATDFADSGPVQDMLARSGKDMVEATEAAIALIGGDTCPIKVQTWNLLLMPLQAPKSTRGGIILTEDSITAMEANNYVAKIIKMGPIAFTVDRMRMKDRTLDAENVPKVGDWVVLSRLSGQKISYKGIRMNIGTDDSVMMVVDDPTDCYVMV